MARRRIAAYCRTALSRGWQASRKLFTKPKLGVERLEDRVLLHAGAHDGLGQDMPGVEIFPNLPTSAADGPSFSASIVGGGFAAERAVGKLPLSSLPQLSSLSSAKASLFLDFDGFYEARWGYASNIRTPAFDKDGDATTYTQDELDTIRAIWKQVAEDYAPFNINVTTVEPPSFANGVALRAAIGGNGAWSGGTYGGIAYVDSFTNSLQNTVYIFAKNLGGGTAKYVAEATSHESGHGFGLEHQSQFINGRKVKEYYAGPGDGRAPIMGNSFDARRGLWWQGTSSLGAFDIQDDMAVISRQRNGFGYRTDDHPDSLFNADALAVDGKSVSGGGIVERISDRDVFSFTSGVGKITLNVNALPDVNNLDVKAELRDAQGTLIASSDPSNSFDASIAATLSRAGSYRLIVTSHGSYGDVGQYSVKGTIVPPPSGSSQSSTPSGTPSGGVGQPSPAPADNNPFGLVPSRLASSGRVARSEAIVIGNGGGDSTAVAAGVVLAASNGTSQTTIVSSSHLDLVGAIAGQEDRGSRAGTSGQTNARVLPASSGMDFSRRTGTGRPVARPGTSPASNTPKADANKADTNKGHAKAAAGGVAAATNAAATDAAHAGNQAQLDAAAVDAIMRELAAH